MNHVDKHQHGFTLIEMMLAMAFVSILMVTIALTVIQLGNIYNKGTTLGAVERAGRSISRDMQYTLAAAPPMKVISDGSGGNVLDTTNLQSQVQVGGDNNNPDGGRLCTGTYSYIWNTGHAISAHAVNPNLQLLNTYNGSSEEIRLVKVRDTGALYCADSTSQIDPSGATELLSAGDRELAVQSLRIIPDSTDVRNQQTLYRIKLEIGTNDADALNQHADINTIDTSCKPPSESTLQTNFCAVNVFDFTVLATNRGDKS